MLHEFLAKHRTDLLARAEVKVASRPAPTRATQEKLMHGIPLFLTQLGVVLKAEAGATSVTPPPGQSHIGLSATRNGNDLLRIGFTVGQVVHCYGDVCQAITELAQKVKFTITTDEFHSLNRALDDAIAEAVTEYGRQREVNLGFQTGQVVSLEFEQRNLLCSAILAWQMLQKGTVGIKGATAEVLGRSLEALRHLNNQSHAVPAIPDPNAMVA